MYIYSDVTSAHHLFPLAATGNEVSPVSSLSLAMNTLPVSVGWWLEGELGVGGGRERWVGVYASVA